MAIDASIPLRAVQPVQPFDPVGFAQKAVGLQEAATKARALPELLAQQLASERAAQLATEASTRATNEGVVRAVQQREEEARKFNASRRWAELGKTFVDTKTGKIDHEGWYAAGLAEGLHPETASELRAKAQAIRESDLRDTNTREEAWQRLRGQLSAEVAYSRDIEDTEQLVETKLMELGKLGFPRDKAKAMLVDVIGRDIRKAPEYARARLLAELTPLRQANLAIAQGQLALGQAAEGRAGREEVRDVGSAVAGATTAIADVTAAMSALDKLKAKYPTKAGTLFSLGLDKYINQPGEMGDVARALQSYERRTGQKLDLANLGYAGVRAALANEKNYYEGQRQAQTAGAPRGVAPVQPATGMVTIMRKSDGVVKKVPADQAQKFLDTGRFVRGQ